MLVSSHIVSACNSMSVNCLQYMSLPFWGWHVGTDYDCMPMNAKLDTWLLAC